MLGIYSSKKSAYKFFKDYLLSFVEYAKGVDSQDLFGKEIAHFECQILELTYSISDNIKLHTILEDFKKIESSFAEATLYNINLVNPREDIELRELELDQPLPKIL